MPLALKLQVKISLRFRKVFGTFKINNILCVVKFFLMCFSLKANNWLATIFPKNQVLVLSKFTVFRDLFNTCWICLMTWPSVCTSLDHKRQFKWIQFVSNGNKRPHISWSPTILQVIHSLHSLVVSKLFSSFKISFVSRERGKLCDTNAELKFAWTFSLST